jgi:GNAT superfamily N-acetyltransferase
VSSGLAVRPGGVDDLPVVLGMLDRAVLWLVARGRVGQWGDRPWSVTPRALERAKVLLGGGGVWLAEVDGEPAGCVVITRQPPHFVVPADEPELYVQLLVTDRAFAGRGIGTALLEHARAQARAAGLGLLRVDCYAGEDGRLVRYYTGEGSTPTERFVVDGWPGQLFAQRLT